MSKERELLNWALIFLHPNVSEEASNLHKEITELLAQPEPFKPDWANYTQGVEDGIYKAKHEPVTNEPTATAMAVMPNGEPVSDVYDAYEAGRKSVMVEQEPVAWKVVDKTTGDFMFSRVKPLKRTYLYDEVIPLYTSLPKREPLSEAVIVKMFGDHTTAIHADSYWAGIEDAGKSHGIGDKMTAIKEQTKVDWDKASIICTLNGYRWYLGPEAEQEMNWYDAKEWCQSNDGELPPRNILLECYMNEDINPLFKTESYWSSTALFDSSAWYQFFDLGNQNSYIHKTTNCYVRAVRAIKLEESR